MFDLFTIKGSVRGWVVLPLMFSMFPTVISAEPDKKADQSALERGLDKRKKKDLTQTISNAKRLYFLLVEFDLDFGAFPNDETAAADPDLKDYRGKYSNDYLGQFIAGGYTQSEDLFFVKGGTVADRKPDNKTTTREQTLQGGECGFAYVKGLSISRNSGRPILCAPMTGKGFKFDPKPYNGKAVVLRIDGAVKLYDIDKNGDVILPDGKKLFEGGAKTVWGEKGLKKGMLVFPKPGLNG